MDKAMMKALEADGEKLRQLTGEDHGPWDITAVNCAVCGKPCDFVANVDPDCDMPNGISGWFCEACKVFTDTDVE